MESHRHPGNRRPAPGSTPGFGQVMLLAALPIAFALYIGIVIGVIAEGLSLGVSALILGLPLALVAGLLVGRISRQSTAAIEQSTGLVEIREAIAPITARTDPTQPERIELIHHWLDPDDDAADVAVLNLARRLAERGYRPRLVLLEAEHLPRDWRRRLADNPEIGPAVNDLEMTVVGSGHELTLNPADQLIATEWRSAHAADRLGLDLTRDGFTYLIREYEPFRYPMGSFAALADAGYELDHRAIFLDELLRTYFADQRLGVFDTGPRLGLRDTVTLNEPILPVRPRSAEALDGADRRRLLIPSRPEEDGSGSLYELALMALDRAVLNGHFRSWDLAALGTGHEETAIVLPRSSARLRVLPREGPDHRTALLPEFDVGIALRYAPGLAPMPVEMAAAGMSVVTTTFAGKDAAALAAVSANLIPVEPRIDEIVAGLSKAEIRTGDYQSRIEGAGETGRPTSWDEALDDRAMDAIEELITRS